MALDINNYDTALQQGATIQTKNYAASSVTGVKTSLTQFYTTIAVGTTGPTAVNVFGSATAPTAGTITGFWTVAATTTLGTFTLFGTTAGTIATIVSSTTIGAAVGTTVLNAAVAAGDTVTVKGIGSGTATAFVTFQTAA